MNRRTFADAALTVAPVALAAAFVGTLFWVADAGPWLRAAHGFVFILAMYGISVALQVRADGRLDEVELAAARFGSRWGLVGGVAFVTLLSLLPPVHSLLAEIADVFGRLEDRGMTGASRLFLLGTVTTFIAQETFRVTLTAAWKWSKR